GGESGISLCCANPCILGDRCFATVPASDFAAENSPPDCFLNAAHPLRLRIPSKQKHRDKSLGVFVGGESGIRTLGTFLYTAFRVVSQIGIPRFFDGILRPPALNRSRHISQGIRGFSLMRVCKPLRIRIIRHFLIFLAIFPIFLAYSRENTREKAAVFGYFLNNIIHSGLNLCSGELNYENIKSSFL
ncbi:MAG: hypothetical protein IK085_02245, partial [Clostridia bacterium]|nr:hypothetical protein [Clostridia bacterium]